MTASNRRQPILDALYGPIELGDELNALIRTPTIQRLRHVRLSNIDSIDMPSIANLSRMEHVIGVAYLAGEVGIRSGLGDFDQLALRSAALLHDWAITSFGHLVEEALQYVGASFDHEDRLREILANVDTDEVGGLDMQILVGRESGLRGWAQRHAPHRHQELLEQIMEGIRGRGRWGQLIAGGFDLDNLDNVYRMAHHLGLEVDRRAPLRIAKSLIGISPDTREPVFRISAEVDIEAWRQARFKVYDHLMLARRDFTGKLMMLSATVGAFEAGEFGMADWSLVDYQLVTLLLRSKVRDVRETAERWIAGELWECTPLYWMAGKRPEYPALRQFSREVSGVLGRHCFAYAIKDKRQRRFSISYDDGSCRTYGADADQWLLGIGSPKREAFGATLIDRAFALASRHFDTRPIAVADAPDSDASETFRAERELQPCLF